MLFASRTPVPIDWDKAKHGNEATKPHVPSREVASFGLGHEIAICQKKDRYWAKCAECPAEY
jgi:hypothetical protein